MRFVQVDLADLEAVEKVGRMLAQELERLDMLFLNAGVFYYYYHHYYPRSVLTRDEKQRRG